MSGARCINVDCRVDASFGQTAVETQFHVARTFELLEDGFVHSAVCIHQCRGKNREASTFLDVACRSEELLRWVERAGIDTTRHDSAGGGCRQVVRARQTCDSVQDDHDVFTGFHHALGFLDGQFGYGGVLVRWTVEGGGDHFALHRSAHVGDFFGSLVDQQHDEFHLGVILLDARGNGLHDRGLACLRRRHDDAALTLADRRDQVDDSCSHVQRLTRTREHQLFVREQRGEFLELLAVAGLLRVGTVHRVHLEQRRVLLVAAGGA